jgi:NADH:ubiquinone oxidoreductase subunit E
MNIKICVGSACHIRGSNIVIEKIKKLQEKYDFEIELKASFCLERCTTNGVSIEIDEEKLTVTPENIEGIVLERMK